MSLKTFGFSAVARALAATAVLGFGMASAPAAYASVESETAALAQRIADALNNSGKKKAIDIRKDIAALIADPAYANADVQIAFANAKALANPKINSAFPNTYSEQAYLAVTEIGNRLNLLYNPPQGGTGGTGSNGGNTGGGIANSVVGARLAVGSHGS